MVVFLLVWLLMFFLFAGPASSCEFKCEKFPGTKPQARSNHQPTINGCGAQGSVDVPDFRWTECCNEHDRCYEKCLYPRDSCDTEWRDCMKSECGNDIPCLLLADVYYAGVHNFGCDPYLKSQEKGCYCAGLFDDEINAIDFGRIIGGPLMAAIEAQTLAARMTVDFMHEIGFELDNDGKKKPVYASFVYEAIQNGTLNTFSMVLPLLIMVPIPYMDIREIDVDFNVKLSQVLKRENNKSTTKETSFSRSANILGLYSYEVKGGSTTKEQLTESEQVNREYDLKVRVQARSRPIPAGTSKILDLFEEIIREAPRSS